MNGSFRVFEVEFSQLGKHFLNFTTVADLIGKRVSPSPIASSARPVLDLGVSLFCSAFFLPFSTRASFQRSVASPRKFNAKCNTRTLERNFEVLSVETLPPSPPLIVYHWLNFGIYRWMVLWISIELNGLKFYNFWNVLLPVVKVGPFGLKVH